MIFLHAQPCVVKGDTCISKRKMVNDFEKEETQEACEEGDGE